MTTKQANDIKQWRTVEDCSWRTVASLFSAKYNETVISNQLYGMELCDEAMKLLEEEIEDGWN
jgi:hypothetical protein